MRAERLILTRSSPFVFEYLSTVYIIISAVKSLTLMYTSSTFCASGLGNGLKTIETRKHDRTSL